jgi:hypothetical protein
MRAPAPLLDRAPVRVEHVASPSRLDRGSAVKAKSAKPAPTMPSAVLALIVA